MKEQDSLEEVEVYMPNSAEDRLVEQSGAVDTVNEGDCSAARVAEF